MGNVNSNVDQPVKRDQDEVAKCVPEQVPSILEIKRVLPSHCFQPSLTTSMYYVFKDLVIIMSLYVAVILMESTLTEVWLVLYPIYWYLQGTMMWAVFVLGHDCGHGSFSKYTLVNDVMGNVLHTIILVPYYPWKLSHQHHHKNTGNIDKDEIFYPVRHSDYTKGGKGNSVIPFFGLGLSWFYYLIKGYSPRPSNHFNPKDPLFARGQVNCLVSVLCWLAWVNLALIPYTLTHGLSKLILHYLLPVFVFASWLVVTTFLHHQDEGVPWYADHKWSFVLGQLSSVDRDYGWAHHLVHHIGTHQIHHLFSKIPHYHLEEATRVFRSKWPHLVRKSDEPILPAFKKMFQLFMAQQWIHDDAEIHVFSSKDKVQ